MNDKAKIGIMAGVLAVLIAGFVFFFLSSSGENSSSSSPNTNTSTPGGAPTATTGAPSGAPGGMPAAAGAPGTPQAAAGVLPPPIPKAVVPQPLTTSVPDPFINFPADYSPPKPIPPPPYISVVSIPFVATKPARTISPTPIPRAKKPSIGRLAGWVYNNNGQVVAIFEDRNGKSRALKVGDVITDESDEGIREFHVIAITTDMLILEDEGGQEVMLKIQSAESIPGNRGTAVMATPTPAVPYGGAR